MKPQTVTVLYTHHIRGDLDMLPRMFTFIRRLRGELAEGRVVLVDLGASCVPEVWPCAITQGRSTLLVLDAMGYHAANTEVVLNPISRAKLANQAALALVDAAHPHTDDGLHFTANPDEAEPDTLTICLTPAGQCQLIDDVLRLATVDSGQVGLARISGSTLVHEIHPLPAGTPPDPTISGAVDFVRDEARYYEKRQQNGG
jgi:hypothetical protein